MAGKFKLDEIHSGDFYDYRKAFNEDFESNHSILQAIVSSSNPAKSLH